MTNTDDVLWGGILGAVVSIVAGPFLRKKGGEGIDLGKVGAEKVSHRSKKLTDRLVEEAQEIRAQKQETPRRSRKIAKEPETPERARKVATE